MDTDGKSTFIPGPSIPPFRDCFPDPLSGPDAGLTFQTVGGQDSPTENPEREMQSGDVRALF